ncbi:MAG: cell wall hydrolase [Pseudomonadota bacterium]
MLRLATGVLAMLGTAVAAEPDFSSVLTDAGKTRVILSLPDELTVTYHSEDELEIEYSREWLSKQDFGPQDAKTDPEQVCLAQAIYFEARGESVKGQFAVAEVILNRVDSAEFPDTICKVVNQGTGRKYACQFSYTCDGRPEHIGEPRAFDRVSKVAHLMADGADRRLTDGATHYHTKSVNPNWSRVFPRTTTIGYHHFYRMPTRLTSN